MIKQIRLQLCDLPLLLITRMITDRIGLHSVLLPLLIIRLNVKHKRYASNSQRLGSLGEINAKALTPAMHFAFHSFLVEVQMNASHT